MTTSTKPIVIPKDLDGNEGPRAGQPLWTSMFEDFGASPISINASEMYSALQTHIADAQETRCSPST